MTIDLLPLKTAIRYIDANPQRWHQAKWGIKLPEDQACGTAFCVAGHIIHQAPGWGEVWFTTCFGEHLLDRAISPTGEDLWPDVAAERILGLSRGWLSASDPERTAHQLLSMMFDATNSRADIQLYAQDLARELGETWDVPLPGWADPEDVSRYRQYLAGLLEEYRYYIEYEDQ